MMKPEYAACIAAIKLRGEPEDDRDPWEREAVMTLPRSVTIKICDPKTQTLETFYTCPHIELRGLTRASIVVHRSRNEAVSYGGEDCRLPTASRTAYYKYNIERADPDNTDETYWMINYGDVV